MTRNPLSLPGRFLIVAAVTLSILACLPPAKAQSIEQMEKSVVLIKAVSQPFDYVTPWKQGSIGSGVGTGFVIEGNRILTNAHNIANSKYIEVKRQSSARRYPARVEFAGHDCDLAILRIDDPSFFTDTIALEIGSLPAINSTVQTYGFPMGGTQISVTEGVVSRIQVDMYSHRGADSHLVIQTDAAINPGNSGGPVIQDGKVVGVAFQGMRQADNIGYMIPSTVINHFLTDIADKKYHGFPSPGFSYFPGLHNKAYGKFLKLPEDAQGVVVLSALMHSSVEGILKKNDCLTKIDSFDIDNDGMINIHGHRLNLTEALEAKQIGDEVKLSFYRKGQLETAAVKVAENLPVMDFARRYDKPSRYYTFAGFVFVPVNRNYLESWGGSWIKDIPFYLKYLFLYNSQINDRPDRTEYIVISSILPDEVNIYSEKFEDSVVEKVNGKPVNSLEDIIKTISQCKDEFVKIDLLGRPMPLIIDLSQAKARQNAILEKYNVPADSNVEGN